MNSLLWIAQILLAAIFLFTGVSKLFAYEFVVDTVEARSAGLPSLLQNPPAPVVASAVEAF